MTTITNTNGHNLPIMLPLNVKSLNKYRDLFKRNNQLHLTLVFLKASDTFINSSSKEIEKMIHNDSKIAQLAAKINMHFHGFSRINSQTQKSPLVAIYNPNSDQDYQALVDKCRRLVRRVSDKMHPGCTREKVGPIEICKNSTDNTVLYEMDIRQPLIHITLKSKATKQDLKKVNKALPLAPGSTLTSAVPKSKLLGRPINLSIRVNKIAVKPQKSITI